LRQILEDCSACVGGFRRPIELPPQGILHDFGSEAIGSSYAEPVAPGQSCGDS
jgi:hypothetical protein